MLLALSQPLPMQSKESRRLISTTGLDVDRISSLCRPLFDEIQLSQPTFIWAGVFGSVSKGTQPPNSDVEIVVGYSPDIEVDVREKNMATFMERLSETLGVKVKVIPVTESGRFHYDGLGAVLSAKTIWGDVSWFETARSTAMDLLLQGYSRIKEAKDIFRLIQQTLLMTEVPIV